MPLAGRPMIEWSLEAFARAGVGVVVAVPVGMADGSITDPDGGKASVGEGGGVIAVVEGGARRAESVANALRAVETELVAIHDAARPLVTAELIESLVSTLESEPEAAGVIAAAPITDTVKKVSGQLSTYAVSNCPLVERTLDRSELWAAQTPQVFRTVALREALAVDEATRDAATDEAMLVEAAGGTVLLHEAAAENVKVTTPLDLRLAELLLAERGG